MNILIISQYFYPESFRINDIASEWVRRGHKVRVVTGIPNYPEGRFYKGYSLSQKRKEKFNGIGIYRLPLIPRGHSKIGIVFNYLSFMISGLMWACFTHVKPDIIFSFETSPMTQLLVGTCLSKRIKVPHIIYVQDLWPENVEEVGGIHNPLVIKPLDKMVKYIYRNADLILATSPSFVKMITSRMNGDRKLKNIDINDKVLYWPQYAEDFYKPVVKKSDGLDGTFKIVFTGNIGYAQGLEILPKCAEYLVKKGYGEKVRFVLVGDGRARTDLENKIDKAGLVNMFEFKGRKQPEEVPAELAQCDVAFLSFANNKLFGATIPAKLQSYMACAMPVLASATGETERIIKKSGCGICTPPGNVEALADAIIRFIDSSSDVITKMSQNSYEYSKAHFSKSKIMDEMEEFLSQLVK